MRDLLYHITEGDKWSAAEGEEEGRPIFLFYRPNLEAFFFDARYIKCVTLKFKYKSTNDSMLPNEFQMEEMQELEDAITAVLESDGQAVLAFSITGVGRKEWIWYSKDHEETQRRVREDLAGFENVPIEVSHEHDPKWTAYFEMLEAVEFDHNDLQTEGGDFDAL